MGASPDGDPLIGLELTVHDARVSFEIQVVPRASRARLGPVVGGRLKVSVNAPPVDGKANGAVIALLARALGVRRANVAIESGERGKRKRVSVAGLDRAGAARALREALA